MAEIDFDKVRGVIEAALDGRPEGFENRPEMTEAETQVIEAYLAHGDDESGLLSEDVAKTLGALRENFYG